MTKIHPLVLELTWVPIRKFAVPAWPIILVKGKNSLADLRRAHIIAHQQSELLVLPFFLLFAWYWAFRTWQTGSPINAWASVPFVREAAHNRDDPSYLTFRRPHAWRLYVDLE